MKTKMQLISQIVNEPIDVIVIGIDEYRPLEAIHYIAGAASNMFNSTMDGKTLLIW
jgi:hypothetical protein